MLVRGGRVGALSTRVARLNTNGSLGRSFGASGIAVTSLPAGIYAQNIKIDRPSGEIVVLGTGLTMARGFAQADTFALARLTSGGGVRRFLTANVVDADRHQSVLVARFSTSTLALVPTFGGGGFVTTWLGSGATFGGGIAVAALSQEPVVVGND